MEKIKPEATDLSGKNPDIEIRLKKPEVEREDLEKAWAQSLFGNGKLVEQIKEIIELKDIKNEDPGKEIFKISNILDRSDVTHNLSILNNAISQDKLKDIQESAFETAVYLGRFALMDGRYDLLHRLREIAFKNLDSAIASTKRDSISRQYSRIFLLGAAESGRPSEQDKAVPVLKEYIAAEIASLNLDKTILDMMEWIVFNEDKNSRNKYTQAVKDYFEKNPRDYNLILACILNKTGIFKEIGEAQIFKILDKFKLGDDIIDHLISEWQYGGGTESYMPEAFARNIETLESIEKERPGIAKFLIEKFGIYNFGRYPESLLIKQYDEYENTEKPYGIVIFAEDDHNAAYFEDKDELEEMANDLKGEYLVRIMEAGSKEELLRLLTRMRLKYGQSHKISFAVVGAHGNKKVITLGNVDRWDREISIRNILRYEGRKYELFEKDATIILVSCQSGKKQGIGSKMSKVLNRTVIAPGDNSGLESIKPIFGKAGKLNFKVKYTHRARATRFKPSQNRTSNVF